MKVQLSKMTTSLRMYCNGDGRIADAPSVSMYEFLRRHLTEYEWDYRAKRNIVRYHYFRYDKMSGILYMPVNILEYLTQYLDQYHVEYDIIESPGIVGKKIHIQNISDFEDRDYQTEAIGFLITDQPMKALELQTGRGKTYVAVRAIMEIGEQTLVIVPASLLVQWTDVLMKISDASVGVIRGSESIMDLINREYQSEHDIFLASINTLQKYAYHSDYYNAFPPIHEFLDNMQFGVKIVDECHLNFNANVMIDIQSDIKHNIYLSATHMRGSKNSNAIFRKVFPEDIRYNGQEYNRYVNITEVRYSLGHINEKLVTTQRGFAQFKYEKYILRAQGKFNELMHRIVQPVVEMYYIEKKRPGQKLLFLVGLRDFAEVLAEWFRTTYPELSSVAFLHETEDALLDKADVIVSTPGSAGTGRDIKGLRTMILFVSFSAESLTLQSLGRLRQMEDTPEFIYMVNSYLKPHHIHAEKRRPIYKHVGKTFRVIDL